MALFLTSQSADASHPRTARPFSVKRPALSSLVRLLGFFLLSPTVAFRSRLLVGGPLLSPIRFLFILWLCPLPFLFLSASPLTLLLHSPASSSFLPLQVVAPAAHCWILWALTSYMHNSIGSSQQPSSKFLFAIRNHLLQTCIPAKFRGQHVASSSVFLSLSFP